MPHPDLLDKKTGIRARRGYPVAAAKHARKVVARDFLRAASLGDLAHIQEALSFRRRLSAFIGRKPGIPRYLLHAALPKAAERGHLEVVRYLLEKGANAHEDDDLALCQAAEAGDLTVVDCLLEAGADARKLVDYSLSLIAGNGYLLVMERLMSAGADFHTFGESALRAAAESGQLAAVQCLIDDGAWVDAGCGAALYGAVKHGRLAVTQCLLAAGADASMNESAALQTAAYTGKAGLTRLLREHGARLAPIERELHKYSPDVQVAALGTGNVADLSAIALARQGVCPEALCALLSQQGQAELAVMLQATQMLEPLAPPERADLLADMLAQRPQPEVSLVTHD